MDLNIVRHGDDYEQQKISQWRLRELLQHERDNAELRTELARLRAIIADLPHPVPAPPEP